LGGRPISIGRLIECDVVLSGDKVSRRHACVVSTPDGPLLVDSSRHGTLINGERMHAPWLLAEGDEVKVGVWTLHVQRAETREIDRRPAAEGPGPG
jgi:pSer/pThr/pTyr-binding forkhead associated (FHA) protein